jgi:hypothetical protein
MKLKRKLIPAFLWGAGVAIGVAIYVTLSPPCTDENCEDDHGHKKTVEVNEVNNDET